MMTAFSVGSKVSSHLIWKSLLGVVVAATVLVNLPSALATPFIVADGSAKSYNFGGSNGWDGSAGSGSGGTICASDGGNGADGGNGSDVVVFYSDPALLKSIQIYQNGGQGGRGGRAGYSGSVNEGVSCSAPRDGQDGRDGRYGSLYLVQGKKPSDFPPAVESKSQSLADALQSALTFSRDTWQKRQGATSLFGQNSWILNEYYFWTGRSYPTYQMIWRATRPFSDFSDVKVNTHLGEKGVSTALQGDILAVVSTKTMGDHTVAVVEAAARRSDVNRIALGPVEKNGTDLRVTVTEVAGLPNEVKTSFYVEYFTQGFLGLFWERRYAGEIPAAWVTHEPQSGKGFTIQLGRMPIDPDYLSQGRAFQLHVYVTRSIGNSSEPGTRMDTEGTIP